MTNLTRALIVVLAAGLSAPAAAQLSRDAAIAKAEAVLANLRDGKIADVVREFDEKMTAEVPESKLKPAWTGLVSQFGPFKGIAERREGQTNGRQAVELFLTFEKETIVQRAVFDSSGKVAGLVFRPASLAVLPAAK
jgi:hypothetical protein